MDPAIASVLSIILVLIGIALVVYIVSRFGKFLIQLIVGLIVNTVLGFVVLFVSSFIFGLNIAYTWPVIFAVAIFGLPAVGTILILKIIGGIALLI